MENLASRLRLRRYKRAVFYGESIGGFPALSAAKYLNASAGISIGGRFEVVGGRLSLPQLGRAYEPFCHCAPKSKTALHAFSVSDHKPDSISSKRLAIVAPEVHQHIFEGHNDHNPFVGLMARGEYNAFMAKLVDLILEDDVTI